jgi:hypothetical protein
MISLSVRLNSYDPADLDHVVASDHLKFELFDGVPIGVRGWPKLATPSEQDDWIEKY